MQNYVKPLCENYFKELLAAEAKGFEPLRQLFTDLMLFKSILFTNLSRLPRTLLRGQGTILRPLGYEPNELPTAPPHNYICTQREIRTPNRELRRFLLFRLSYLGKLYSKEDSNPYFNIRNNVMDIVMFISLAFFRLNY